MAQGVDVEWVRTAKPGESSRPPEELEAELRELRDEVRRLREQVAALAATSPRPMPEDARIPTYVARLDTSLEGGVPKAGVIAITGPGGSMKTSLALYILIKNRAAGRRGVYVTVEESRESILRTMRHHGLGTDGEFLVDIARLRVEHEGAGEVPPRSPGVRRRDTRPTRGIPSSPRTTRSPPRDRTRRPGRPEGAGASVTKNAPFFFARSFLTPGGVPRRFFSPPPPTSPP